QDGSFSRERSEQFLEGRRASAAQFEEQQERRAIAGQLQRALAETALVTDRELRDLLRLQGQERDTAWLTVRVDPESVSVSDEDVQSYYEDNADEFMRPEQVQLRYLEITRDGMLDAVEVDDDTIRERYEQVKNERYTEGGRLEARHILIEVPEDASDQRVEEARDQIRAWREQIREGEASFEELAREHSDDPGSARQGGDLGRIRRGDMVEPFEEAAFGLDEGELSEPVRTQFGFHLIQATSASQGDVTPLDEVRDELRQEIAGEQVRTRYVEALNRLDELAFDNPQTLEPAADELDRSISETDWIPRGGTDEGIGSHDEVLSAAFDPEVLEDGRNSPLVELGDDRGLILRVSEHREEAQRPLEEVRDTVAERVRERQAGEQAQAIASDLEEQWQAGESVSALEESSEAVTLEEAGWIGRNDSSVASRIRDPLFRMQPPGDDEVRTRILESGSERLVLGLRDVRAGDPESIPAEQRQQLRERLRQARGQQALTRFLEQLRGDTEVTIHDEDYRD
ncbi:MAG: peptidylprolyl isomerase, partial [Ectothiorhodospiraceae bacterium]